MCVPPGGRSRTALRNIVWSLNVSLHADLLPIPFREEGPLRDAALSTLWKAFCA